MNFRDLARKFNDNQVKLADVRDYGTAYDDKGERVPVPVYTFQGTAREGILREQDELNYHMNLLSGPEGQRRLQKALKESVEV